MTPSHTSSGSSRWSTADFRCADVCRLEQGVSPWRCSALLMVTFETVVPALFRSLSRSSSVVLVWFLIFLITIGSLWGESLHDSPDWGFNLVDNLWDQNCFWLLGDQILISCNKIHFYLKIIQCDFPNNSFFDSVFHSWRIPTMEFTDVSILCKWKNLQNWLCLFSSL